jgi:hypothetical protein
MRWEFLTAVGLLQMGLLRHRAQDDQEADGATAAGNQGGVARNHKLHFNVNRQFGTEEHWRAICLN